MGVSGPVAGRRPAGPWLGLEGLTFADLGLVRLGAEIKVKRESVGECFIIHY